MILTPLQKLPKNVEDLGKLIVAKGFKKLPKVQKIANSGYTGRQGGGKQDNFEGRSIEFEIVGRNRNRRWWIGRTNINSKLQFLWLPTNAIKLFLL